MVIIDQFSNGIPSRFNRDGDAASLIFSKYARLRAADSLRSSFFAISTVLLPAVAMDRRTSSSSGVHGE